MRKSSIWLSFFLWVLVAVAYAFRRPIQQGGFPIDPYYLTLFAFPILLIIFRKFSFSDLGLRIGKPLVGLFFVFLLPAILFLRWRFMGIPFHLSQNYFPMILIGSIAEEFFFRGYLQEEFKKSFGTNISFLITNLLFALVHFVKGYSLAPTLITGLIGVYFSLTKDKQGGNSLIYSMGAHSLFNLVVSSMPQLSRVL